MEKQRNRQAAGSAANCSCSARPDNTQLEVHFPWRCPFHQARKNQQHWVNNAAPFHELYSSCNFLQQWSKEEVHEHAAQDPRIKGQQNFKRRLIEVTTTEQDLCLTRMHRFPVSLVLVQLIADVWDKLLKSIPSGDNRPLLHLDSFWKYQIQLQLFV
eukprot:1157845-Pelagomonas_calceolata.AAC.7